MICVKGLWQKCRKLFRWTARISFGKCYQDSSKVTEQVHDNNNVVQGANKLLGGPK